MHMIWSSVFTWEQPVFIPTMPKVNNKTEMDTMTITEDNKILSILNKINISKSPDPDKISTRLLIEQSDMMC